MADVSVELTPGRTVNLSVDTPTVDLPSLPAVNLSADTPAVVLDVNAVVGGGSGGGDYQPKGSAATFASTYTITTEQWLGAAVGTDCTVTLPLVADRDGETIVVFSVSGTTTLECSGADTFPLSASTSVDILAGDVLQIAAVAGLGWVASIRSGGSFDLPGWVTTPPNDGDVVIYLDSNGFPTWDKASDGRYLPSNGTHWDGADPTTVGAALDRIAALLYTLNGNVGP